MCLQSKPWEIFSVHKQLRVQFFYKLNDFRTGFNMRKFCLNIAWSIYIIMAIIHTLTMNKCFIFICPKLQLCCEFTCFLFFECHSSKISKWNSVSLLQLNCSAILNFSSDATVLTSLFINNSLRLMQLHRDQ